MNNKPRVVDPPCLVHPDDEVPATIEIPKEDAKDDIKLGVVAEQTARNWGYQIVEVDVADSTKEMHRLEVMVKAK